MAMVAPGGWRVVPIIVVRGGRELRRFRVTRRGVFVCECRTPEEVAAAGVPLDQLTEEDMRGTDTVSAERKREMGRDGTEAGGDTDSRAPGQSPGDVLRRWERLADARTWVWATQRQVERFLSRFLPTSPGPPPDTMEERQRSALTYADAQFLLIAAEHARNALERLGDRV